MKMKKILALALATLLIGSVAMLAGCGEPELSADAAYKVTLTDPAGVPYTKDIVVKFMQNGQQAAMQTVDANGVAEKTMPRGDYTVELQFMNADITYLYNTDDLQLTADKTELTIQLSQKLGEQTQELSVGTAYMVGAGCTTITLGAEGRSYYIFTPQEEGKYEVSLIGSDAAIGNYGGSVHYVWETSASEVVDNKFSVNVKKSQLGGAVIIIGVEAGTGEAVLSVQNIGAPDWSVEDEPWIHYQATCPINPYTLPAGAQVNKFDIKATTETYRLVLNEADGYYHLNTADGPLVLVQLGNTSAETEYLPPFETILEKQGIRRYFFDAEGNFEKKEEYSDCLLKYIENVDEASGLYPLNSDLKYIIEQQGIQAGWFDPNSSGYLFVDQDYNKIVGINDEISWLFMCRYL